jgi:hypothetical protein
MLWDVLTFAGPVPFAIVPAILLFIVRTKRGMLWVWRLALATLIVALLLAVAFEDPKSETSAFASAIAVGLPAILGAAALHVIPRRWPSTVAVLLTAIVAGFAVIPSYLAGCVAAEYLPVNGCFF